MTTLEIIELCILGGIALILIIFYSIKAIKNKWISQIIDTIEKAIKEAEESGKSGDEKKAYVMLQVEKKCEELGIPFRLIYTLVSTIIDKIIKDYNVIAK